MDDQDHQHVIGSIQSPEDLYKVPGYSDSLDLGPDSGRTVIDAIDDYSFKELFPCGIKSCNNPHKRGYLVITSDGKITNIGNICGKTKYGFDFTTITNRFAAKKRDHYNRAFVDQLESERSLLSSRLNRISAVALSLKACRRHLYDSHPDVHIKIIEAAKQHSGQIVIDRRMTKKEAQAHYAATNTSRHDYPGGRPVVQETKGRFSGFRYFVENADSKLEKEVSPSISTLLDSDQITLLGLEESDLNSVIKKGKKAISALPNIEEALVEGLKFFTAENLSKLYFYDIAEDGIKDIVSYCEGALSDFRDFRVQSG